MFKRGALLSLSFIFVSGVAHALAYSSTTRFQVTDARVTAQDFQNYYKNAQEIIQNRLADVQIVNQIADRFAPELKSHEKAHVPSTVAIDITIPKGKMPTRNPQHARIFVVDEEALLNGKIKGVPGAYILPINPNLNSTLTLKTNAQGLASLPYLLSESARFFVRAPDYMMGMGYATFGNVTIVPLVSKKRFSTFAKSLNLHIPGGQLAVYGKLTNSDLKGISASQIKFKTTQPQMFYSGPFFGGLPGYFIPQYQTTDTTGSFIANGLSRTSHSVQILNRDQVIPGFDFDLSGIPEVVPDLATGLPETVNFISLALQNGPSINISSSLLDGDTFERPECGLKAIISNHMKPAVPDADGNMWIESKQRPSVNNVTINTDSCEGYLPTFVTQASHAELFPPTVGLFTTDEIQSMLADLHRSWDPTESLVLAHVYPQKEFKHAPIKEVSVMIFSSSGERVPAEVIYYDHDNRLDTRKAVTDSHVQNFMVLGLEEGEYHFVYRRGARGSGLGIQVVRIKKGGVTQVDF